MGQIINGVAEYRVPLFDMFLFLKEQMESNNIQLEGMEDMTDMLTQLDTARAQMRSDNYSRMVVYLNVPEEGEETYNFLQEMRGIIGQYYEDDYYIVGNSTSSRDLSASFETDNLIITILSITFVAVVLLIGAAFLPQGRILTHAAESVDLAYYDTANNFLFERSPAARHAQSSP